MLLFKGDNDDNNIKLAIDIVIDKVYDFAIDIISALIYSSFY